MKVRYRYPILFVVALALVLVAVFAQNGTCTPGQFQTSNPNYPKPNPFYFEGKIDWNLLGITQPQNTWEFLQRGMHFQDDVDDIPSAMSDYQTSLSMNSLQNQTCQIVTAATLVNGTVPTQLSHAPGIFTGTMRQGLLLRETNPRAAVGLIQEG